MKNPYATFDATIAPLIIIIHKIRQARDAQPVWVWRMIPGAITRPLQELFDFAEQYDRGIGRAQRDREAVQQP